MPQNNAELVPQSDGTAYLNFWDSFRGEDEIVHLNSDGGAYLEIWDALDFEEPQYIEINLVEWLIEKAQRINNES